MIKVQCKKCGDILKVKEGEFKYCSCFIDSRVEEKMMYSKEINVSGIAVGFLHGNPYISGNKEHIEWI